MCFQRCFQRCFCVYSLADSGERRKPRRAGHPGVRRGQDKEFVLKLSWPSTAEYRMMKKKAHYFVCRPAPKVDRQPEIAPRKLQKKKKPNPHQYETSPCLHTYLVSKILKFHSCNIIHPAFPKCRACATRSYARRKCLRFHAHTHTHTHI